MPEIQKFYVIKNWKNEYWSSIEIFTEDIKFTKFYSRRSDAVAKAKEVVKIKRESLHVVEFGKAMETSIDPMPVALEDLSNIHKLKMALFEMHEQEPGADDVLESAMDVIRMLLSGIDNANNSVVRTDMYQILKDAKQNVLDYINEELEK